MWVLLCEVWCGVVLTWQSCIFFFFFVDIFIFIFLLLPYLDPLDVHVAQTIPLFLWVCVFLVSQFLKWLGHNAPCLKVGWWCNVLCMRVMNCVAVTISCGNWQLGLEFYFYINCRFRRRKVHFCEFCLTESLYYCAQNFITNFRTSNC